VTAATPPLVAAGTGRRKRDVREDLLNAPSWLLSVAGLTVVIGLWWFLARVWLSQNQGLPTPFNVVKSLYNDGWGFYWPIVHATASRALPGYLLGNAIAIGLAFFVLLVPAAEKVVMQIAVASYCLPIVAVGPILVISLNGNQPAIALVVLFVLFTTLVGTLLGMRSADPTSLDLVSVYGGNGWAQLRKVRIIAALPSILTSLRLACPAAVLGAVLGEYFGGVSMGLGPTMVNSQANLNVPRTWGCALVAAALGGFGYIGMGLLSRFLTPWARATTTAGNS
jgi:ABC-type nitrate/sulfonate/bicarbonate transport system permease component